MGGCAGADAAREEDVSAFYPFLAPSLSLSLSLSLFLFPFSLPFFFRSRASLHDLGSLLLAGSSGTPQPTWCNAGIGFSSCECSSEPARHHPSGHPSEATQTHAGWLRHGGGPCMNPARYRICDMRFLRAVCSDPVHNLLVTFFGARAVPANILSVSIASLTCH